MSKTKVKAAVGVLTAAICVGMAFFWYDAAQKEKTKENAADANIQRISYDASVEIEEAMKKLEDGCEPAQIIRDNAGKEEQKAAIVFQGLSDRTTNRKILDLLKKYDIKAAFVVPGMLAAEDSDTMQDIVAEGHVLGSNALSSESAMEEMETGELVENFARAGKIHTMLTDKEPELLFCNSTRYTEGVRQAAAATGTDKVLLVNSGHYLNYSSFKDYEQTKNYVNRLTEGSILMVKMQGALDALEFQPKEKVAKPDADKQTGVGHEETEENLSEEEELVRNVEWLLQAMKEAEMETDSVLNFPVMSEEEYAQALLQKGEGALAEVFNRVMTQEQAVGLSFTGMPEGEKLTEVLDLLEDYGADATFFVNGEEDEANKESVLTVRESGYALGNDSMSGGSLKGLGPEEAYENIALSDRQIRKEYLIKPRFIMLAEENCTDSVRKAVNISGYTIIAPKNPEKMEAGEIYNMNLAAEDFRLKQLKKLLEQAKNKKMAVYDLTELFESGAGTPELPQEMIDSLRADNGGRKAEEIKMVQTTEPAMAFLFFGVENEPVLQDIASTLNARGYKGTFFVTYQEMRDKPEAIEMLRDAGQKIGIAYTETKSYPTEFDSVARYIITCQNYLKWRYGIETVDVKMPYGEVKDEMKEAVSATSCRLIGHEIAMVQSKQENAENAEKAFASFRDKVHLKRGSLVYFHMNFLKQDRNLKADYEGETMCGDLMRHLIRDKVDTIAYQDAAGKKASESAYGVKGIDELLSSKYMWKENTAPQHKIAMDKNVLTSMETEEERFAYMQSHYIGNPDVKSEQQLPGFTGGQIEAIDKTGMVSEDKVLYITLDDWGTDESINHLLYVFKKHDVKVTFFCRTNMIQSNPNLLRAMALDGHEIASHTNAHLPLSHEEAYWNPDDPEQLYHRYHSLSGEETLALRQDLVESYNVLHRYVGDVEVDGVPALSTNFRPPTLAVSKAGLYQVFDTGFTHSISGDFSTHDYAAETVEDVLSTFENGVKISSGMGMIRDGSCIVMHMSDTSRFTAQALDIMIPVWKSQGYQFRRLDSVLR